jgi:hypothetical protein
MIRTLPRLVLLILATAVFSGCATTVTEPDTVNVFEGAALDENVGNPELQQEEGLALADSSGADPELMLANADATEAVVDPKTQKRCTKEKRTGSRIPKKYCRTLREDEAQREAGQAWIKTIQNKPRWNTENN